MKSDDLISREEALCMLEFNKHNYYGCGSMKDIDKVMQDIKNLDAVDADPVRHAAWVYEIDFEDENKRNDFDVTCTGCGALFSADNRDDAEIVIMGRWDYCPLCGAKMDAEVNNDGSNSAEY